jgi:hypothetical protein
MTRNERRLQAKPRTRHLKKVHRAALHGLTGQCAPPSLLQSVRMAIDVQKRQAELAELFKRANETPAA